MNKNRTEPSSSSLDNPAKSSRRASSTAGGGDIIVIARLIFNMMHTLHLPSGLVQCMHRIEYQPGDNYYLSHKAEYQLKIT